LAESYRIPFNIRVVGNAGETGHAQTLIDQLADETTVTCANVNFLGLEERAISFASGMSSGLEMGSGIVFSTGDAGTWNGGNVEGEPNSGDAGLTSGEESTGGDLPIELQATGLASFNAVVLECDITATYRQLELELQYASEEYIEFISEEADGDCFNDIFLVTLEGVPMSLTPDCSALISVSSIHPHVDPIDSLCGLAHPLMPRNEEFYVRNNIFNQSNRVEFDGMTVTLRLHALVEPGQDYRLKIVLADLEDHFLDSAVFFKTASLRSINPNQ